MSDAYDADALWLKAKLFLSTPAALGYVVR